MCDKIKKLERSLSSSSFKIIELHYYKLLYMGEITRTPSLDVFEFTTKIVYQTGQTIFIKMKDCF